jgi:hypothetical protein
MLHCTIFEVTARPWREEAYYYFVVIMQNTACFQFHDAQSACCLLIDPYRNELSGTPDNEANTIKQLRSSQDFTFELMPFLPGASKIRPYRLPKLPNPENIHAPAHSQHSRMTSLKN